MRSSPNELKWFCVRVGPLVNLKVNAKNRKVHEASLDFLFFLFKAYNIMPMKVGWRGSRIRELNVPTKATKKVECGFSK